MAFPITRVRRNPEQARAELETFLFGGRMIARRAPRGIDPKFVGAFIRERVKPDSPATAFQRAGDLARFYERPEVASHVAGMSSTQDFDRLAYILQILGDVGNQAERSRGAEDFQKRAIEHPQAMQHMDLLLETMVALAPAVQEQAVYERLSKEIARAVPADKKRLEGVQTGALPRAMLAASLKRTIPGLPPPDRRVKLIDIYLGRSDVNSDQMVVWAARLLRREAMTSPAPVIASLAENIDKAENDFEAHRAAEAVLYFGGKLTTSQRRRYESAPKQVNFLSDAL